MKWSNPGIFIERIIWLLFPCLQWMPKFFIYPLFSFGRLLNDTNSSNSPLFSNSLAEIATEKWFLRLHFYAICYNLSFNYDFTYQGYTYIHINMSFTKNLLNLFILSKNHFLFLLIFWSSFLLYLLLFKGFRFYLFFSF